MARLDDRTVEKVGLTGQDDSQAKYSQILDTLDALRKRIQSEGFEVSGRDLLESVYGQTPTASGRLLQGTFDRCQEMDMAGDSASEEERRTWFLYKLNQEIKSFKKLFLLSQEKDKPLTEPMKDAQLLPGQQDLEKIMRYEAALERQFERKLQQLVSWRREKRESSGEEVNQ